MTIEATYRADEIPPHKHSADSPFTGCFGCKIKSIQVSPKATPSRRNNIPPAQGNNSYEKGILRDDRGLPIRRGGKVIPIKQAAAQRRKIDGELTALKQGHDPASPRS